MEQMTETKVERLLDIMEAKIVAKWDAYRDKMDAWL
jgi:hypothetical protein